MEREAVWAEAVWEWELMQERGQVSWQGEEWKWVRQ
jgi:hypothetical protein